MEILKSHCAEKNFCAENGFILPKKKVGKTLGETKKIRKSPFGFLRHIEIDNSKKSLKR